MNIFYALDPLYWLLVGPAILLALYAQMKVKSAYLHFSRVGTARGFSGAEAAGLVLSAAGVPGCRIEETHGWLSDHYDPLHRVLRLSPGVYGGRSVAAVGIAAHEAGHAIQHARGYAMLRLRSAMVPVVGLGSWLAWPIILAGAIFQSLGLVQLGILLFSGLVVFQLITLPVEFDASARARKALAGTGVIIDQEEAEGVSTVLSAAAMTYVAATVAAIAQLLYFLIRFGLLGSRND